MNKAEHQSKIGTIGRMTLLLGSNMVMMAGSSLSPGVPAIQETFQGTPGLTFWTSLVLTLPALFVVLGGPLMGYLVDRFGRKPVLIGSIISGGIFGSAAYFLQSLSGILITRALIGLSIAGSMTATNSLVADFFKGEERAKYLGQVFAFTGVSGVVFMTIGGFLANIDWHYSFLTYIPALLIAPLAIIFIHEPKEVVAHEADALTVKFKLDPTSIYIFIAIMFNQLAYVAVPVFIATYLKDLVGAGSVEAGLVSALANLCSFLGGLAYGRIHKRYGFLRINTVSFLIYSLGFLAIAMAQNWTLILIGEMVLGFGMGVIPSNLSTWLAHETHPLVRGRANGIYVTMMFLGNFATSIIFTPISQATSLQFIYCLSAIVVVMMSVVGVVHFRSVGKVNS